MSQFAVIGLGNFGSTVASELAKKGLPVVAVDLNPSRVDDLRNKVSHAVVGDVTEKQFIASSGIGEVDVAIVALGDDIETSVLATLNLAESGVENIIVKGISEEHATIVTAVGATEVIFPEKEMAQKIAASIAAPNIIDHIPLTEGYSIIEMVSPKAFEGKTLLDLNLRREYGVELLAIKRADPKDDPPVIVVPGAGAMVKTNDKLIILGSEEDVQTIQEL